MPPPKISEEQVSARREQIIMATVSCFADRGFHKTTMQDICKAARLSPGAVYHYYASKDEMNQQLFEFAMPRNTPPLSPLIKAPSACLSTRTSSRYTRPVYGWMPCS